MHVPICCEEHLQNLSDVNHRKCQKAHSGIVSSRQGLGQARTLARCLYKKIAVWSFELCDRTAIFMMCTTLREDFGTILFCSFYFDKDMLYYF